MQAYRLPAGEPPALPAYACLKPIPIQNYKPFILSYNYFPFPSIHSVCMATYRPVQTYQRLWRRKVYRPRATLPAHAVDCPECGLRNHIPQLSQGQEAACSRCGHELVRVESNPYMALLAYTVTTLILLAIVYSQMFLTIELPGVYSHLTLPGMMKTLILQDWGFLAEVMFIFIFGTPLLFLLLALYVYIALARQRFMPYLLYATRTLVRLRAWIMIDVFFISTLVAYIKMRTVSVVEFGPAFWLMFVLGVMLIRTAVSVPEHWVYYQIHHLLNRTPIFPADNQHICCSRCLYFQPIREEECGVCGTDLFNRRPHSIRISLCFLIAAAVLYFPANLFPIMISSNPINLEISTILTGIQYMWNDGDRLIAVIIFSASIVVPTLKIMSMAVLLASTRIKMPMSIGKMSVLYRITEWIGRWSMIDIFVIILLMSAFHTPMARVLPGPASIYFCLVVLLTMLSAHFFDPRLLWDKAIHQQSEPHD